ncbi:ATP-grasp domain-containing protein [Mycoplasmatota bacterium]|nr:ATP-grasp domain-containing protein [Mycoplasmatota bacterium]
MKAVVFIKTNKSGLSRDVIKACDRLNYYTILITDNKKQINQLDEYHDVHQMLYLEDLSLDKLKKYIKQNIKPHFEIVSILSFVDGYVTLASRLRDKFTFNPRNTNALEIMESKLRTREVFKDYDFSPIYIKAKMNKSDAFLLNYPFIIKKSSSSASRDVKKVDTVEDIPESFYNSDDVLVEEYVDGEQYLFEVFVENGNPVYIVKFHQDNIYTKNNSFIILGYSLNKDDYITSNEEKIIIDITKKLEVQNGELHIEMRKNGDIYKLIEINPRTTGTGMNDIMKVASGIDYAEQILKFYLKEDFELPKVKENVYTHFLISEKEGESLRVTGKIKALNSPGVEVVFIKRRKGNYIRKPRHMGDRNGYIIATGETVEDAKKAALDAAKKITFHLREDE